MHRFTTFLFVAALGSGMSLAAQTPSPAPPSQASATQPSTLVLTGCLRSAPRADTNSPGDAKVYTLDVNDPAATATVPPATTQPGAPAKSSASTPTKYTLTAPESVGLLKHVNHEVELTGRLQGSSTASQPGAPGSGTKSEGKAMPGGAHRTFEVSALKMLSANCS